MKLSRVGSEKRREKKAFALMPFDVIGGLEKGKGIKQKETYFLLFVFN